jgi:soluble lytic murein transglycosylase-like protein
LADIYSFTDKDGVIHFTNVPTDSRFKLIIKETDIDDYRSLDYMSLISKISKKYRVDDALIRAIIKVESDFNPRAVSKAGAKGLMQLMPETAKDLGVENIFNPEENVEGGVKYLKSLIFRFEDNLPLAIAAYHAGGGAVKKYNAIPPFDSTQKFVKKVLNYFEKYKNSSSTGKD